ncbi:hypothetical protein [Pseudomonas asiatica]|uniref:hypothetical protein n=1 Tax=Pseudomonas asiatica TaxID=2219225 RepID=UPI00345B2D2E
MPDTDNPRCSGLSKANHIALHLAHRWFAFLEAPGGDLNTHLEIFHPHVTLTGHRTNHRFAHDHESLMAWFNSIPDQVSSHHIVHSTFALAKNGDGLLDMVVAYQTPSESGIHGSIISYETRIEFAADAARFIALDKTPILANKRPVYETSWSSHRSLARIHAELAGLSDTSEILQRLRGEGVERLSAVTCAPEGSVAYQALVNFVPVGSDEVGGIVLTLRDDVAPAMPTIDASVLIAGLSV